MTNTSASSGSPGPSTAPVPPTSPTAPTLPDAGYSELFSRDLIRLTIGTLVLLGCNAFEIVGSATVMPAVLDDLGGVGLYGSAVAASIVGAVLSAPFGGRLADRFDTLPPLLGALGLFAIGLVGCTLAPSMAALVAARFVMGLGIGSTLTLQLVIIARYVPVELRPKLLAVVSVVFIVPGLIGPTVTSTVSESVGWRWVFGGVVPLLAVCVVLLVPEIRRRPHLEEAGATEPDGMPTWGPFLLAGGLGVTTIAGGAGDARWLVLAAAGLAALVAGARATMPSGTWTARRGMPAAVACALAASGSYLTVEAFLPLMLQEIKGQSLFRAGLPLTFAAFFWAAGAWFQARIGEVRRPVGAMSGALVSCGGLLLAASLAFEAVPFWLAYPATALGSFGCGLAYTLCQAIAVEWAPPGGEGAATASVQLANLLGTALGTCGGAIVIARLSDDLRLAVGLTMLVAAGLSLVAAFAARRLPTERPVALDPG
jgi:MFS family permease